jgi:hypothetical protein
VVSDNRTLLSLQLQLLASASRLELVSVLLLHRVVWGSQAFPLRRQVLELLLLQSAAALKLHLEQQLFLPLLRLAHLHSVALQLPAGSVLPHLVLRPKPALSRSLPPLRLHLAALKQPRRLFSCSHSHTPSSLRLLVLAPLPPLPPANR